jgi:peptidoglycan/LPS O-acetylase OafA/YrhL
MASSNDSTHRQPTLHALTGFRFCAALMVFFHHVNDLRFREGYSGVTFFLILSGFILTYNYAAVFERLQWSNLWRFHVARFTRIYPVHVLSFLLFLPYWWGFMALDPKHWGKLVALNLGLVHAWNSRFAVYFSFNTPAWSLCNECLFYLLLPFFLRVCASIRLISVLAAPLALALWLGQLGYAWHVRTDPDYFWLVYVQPPLRLIDFSIGMLLCFAYLSFRQTFIVSVPVATATVVEAGSMVLLLVAFLAFPNIPFAVRLGSYYTLPMALVIATFACERGLLSRFLAWRPCRALGEISFSFFMLHFVVLGHVAKYKSAWGLDGWPGWTRDLLALAVSLILAAVCYWTYEMPIRNAVKGWLRRRPLAVSLPPVQKAA